MTAMSPETSFAPLSSEGPAAGACGADRHRRTARTAKRRAIAVAVGFVAMSAAGAAEAQDVFLKCGSRILSFNASNNSIQRYNEDGESLGSLCTLPRDSSRTYPNERIWARYSNLTCNVSDSRVEISVTRSIYRQLRAITGLVRWDPETFRSSGGWSLLRINRRTGEEGICEPIERPQPRANRF